MPSQTSQQVLVERLSNLQTDVTDIKSTSLPKIEASIACFGGNLDRLERLYLVEHEKMNSKVDAAHRRLDDHAGKITDQSVRSETNTRRIEEIAVQIIKLEKTIQPLIKILVWLGVTFFGSLIALIWSIVTHQVTLVFP